MFLLNVARAIGAIALRENFLAKIESSPEAIRSLRTKRDGCRNDLQISLNFRSGTPTQIGLVSSEMRPDLMRRGTCVPRRVRVMRPAYYFLASLYG